MDEAKRESEVSVALAQIEKNNAQLIALVKTLAGRLSYVRRPIEEKELGTQVASGFRTTAPLARELELQANNINDAVNLLAAINESLEV